MAKKKPARDKKETTKKEIAKVEPQQVEPEKNGMRPWVKPAIIAGTFGSIIALSILTEGAGDVRPGIGVVSVRIALLSLTAIVYFGMLYYTRASRQNEENKAESGKK